MSWIAEQGFAVEVKLKLWKVHCSRFFTPQLLWPKEFTVTIFHEIYRSLGKIKINNAINQILLYFNKQNKPCKLIK